MSDTPTSAAPRHALAAAGAPPILLAACALATIVAACWLAFVSVTVLPAQDPQHVAAWRAIAGAMLAFAGLSLAALRPGARALAERAALGVFAVAAVGSGLGAAVREATAPAGAHFEGYLLVLGLLVAVHGAAALALLASGGTRGRA